MTPGSTNRGKAGDLFLPRLSRSSPAGGGYAALVAGNTAAGMPDLDMQRVNAGLHPRASLDGH
jgi:hypothetical protein